MGGGGGEEGSVYGASDHCCLPALPSSSLLLFCVPSLNRIAAADWLSC